MNLGNFRVRLPLSGKPYESPDPFRGRDSSGKPGKLRRGELAELNISLRLLDCGTNLDLACPAVGVYSSATAEGILKILDEV